MSLLLVANPVSPVDMPTYVEREGSIRAQAFFESNPKIKAIAEVIGYLGYFTLAVRSAGFVFLATPLGISAGLVYGSAAYLSNKICNLIVKGNSVGKKIVCLTARAYIAQSALSLTLGVKISFTASFFIPAAPVLAGILGAGTIVYWAVTALAVVSFAGIAFDFENGVESFFKNLVTREEFPIARVEGNASQDVAVIGEGAVVEGPVPVIGEGIVG